MIRVILLIDCSSEFDRRLLRGIMRYSKENGSWLFYRMPSSLRSGSDREKLVLDWAKEWKADAVIGRWDEDKVEMLSVLDIPVVLQKCGPFQSDRRLLRNRKDGSPVLHTKEIQKLRLFWSARHRVVRRKAFRI